MPFVWDSKGVIFSHQDYPLDWATSHTQIPTVLDLKDRLRIFYATRMQDGRSVPTFFDVRRENPSDILYIHKEPIMNLGEPGAFDEDGVMPSMVWQEKGITFLQTIGWRQGVRTPYHNAIGLAQSTDAGVRLQRTYVGPILDRTPEEPYMAITPFLLSSDSKEKILYYGSGTKWVEGDAGKFEPVYVIKRATSENGIEWKRDPKILLAPKDKEESTVRPSVIFHDNQYHMWFCHRSAYNFRGGKGSYDLGYAHSKDGKKWTRSHIPLTLERGIWDSNMRAYPYVVILHDLGKIYLFYNGNDFGQTGIGCAETSLK